jgi:hypothetical protein
MIVKIMFTTNSLGCSDQNEKADKTAVKASEIVGINCTEKIEAEDAVDQHDKEYQAQHVQNGRQALKYLTNEPSYTTAVVIVHQKNGPESSGGSEVCIGPG